MLSIVVVPENEMLPEMGVGIACKFQAKPVIARIRQVIFGVSSFVSFICFFLLSDVYYVISFLVSVVASNPRHVIYGLNNLCLDGDIPHPI